MPAYNFKKQFVPFIEAGTKTHTIRAKRARQTMPGEILALYTGMRQKGCRLILRTVCTSVDSIFIDKLSVWINGERLDLAESRQLAIRDGFKDFVDMLNFWEGRLPFEGEIIHWRPPC